MTPIPQAPPRKSSSSPKPAHPAGSTHGLSLDEHRTVDLVAGRGEEQAGRSLEDEAGLLHVPTSATPETAVPPPAGIDWPVVLWIGGVHLATLLAPFYFSWSGLAICLALYYVTGSLGVCLGYHRLLTHGSFATVRPVRLLFAWLGGVSGEGSALMWVANHRKHHAFSDQEGDPHSPRDGGLWAHLLWMFTKRSPENWKAHVARWAPDLDRDWGMHFLENTFLVWHLLIGGALLAAGWACGGPRLGVSWLLWGLAVRMVIVFHVTWLVNSASHMWGYRNYETTDDSRNLWWVGLLAFGEGWHNNHHAYQRMAKHGHRWWEVDVTYWVIVGLEKAGLAWNVVHDPYGKPLAAKAAR